MGVEYSKDIKPYIYRKAIYKKNGDELDVFDGAGKALGIIFFRFKDEKTMTHFSENITDHIKIILA